MNDESVRSHAPRRAWANDLLAAVALAEGSVAQRVIVALDVPDVMPPTNAFAERVVVEWGRADDVVALVGRCADAAMQGERAALLVRAADLTRARSELARVAALRIPVVVHAFAEPGAEGTPPSDAGVAPALALRDLPWGMLLASGASEAVDLALIARRAAEDSGRPFFVVHERSFAHHVEPVAAPSSELCDAFLGRPSSGVRPSFADGSERALAARVPFALASAMRDFEALTTRRHDVIERAPAADASVALVGAGTLGDSLLADVDRLRATGHDVGAVRVVAWRPFPGPRLVKALCRALAISVLDGADDPLAASGPLARELKAAFADALTWAPDYPGIGRVPRIVAGIVAPRREIDATDLDALVLNLLADERGKRTFVLGGDDATALSAPPVARLAPRGFAMRGYTAREDAAFAAAHLAATVFASLLGVRARVAIRTFPPDEGGGTGFDLLAGRERPRGGHAPHATRVIAIADAHVLARGNPLARLAPGGVLALPTAERSADALWSEVPSWAKAVVFERGVRVVGWSPGGPGEDPLLVAASFAGLALAAALRDGALSSGQGVEGEAVEREVADAIRSTGPADPTLPQRGGRAAREVFEAQAEGLRAKLGAAPEANGADGARYEGDDGLRVGRRDAPATAER